MKNVSFLLAFFLVLSCSNKAGIPPATGMSIFSTAPVNPVIRGLSANPMVRVAVYLPEGAQALNIKSIQYTINAGGVKDIQSVEIINNGREPLFKPGLPSVLSDGLTGKMNTPVDFSFTPGYNYIWFSAVLKNTSSLDGIVELHIDQLTDDKGKTYKIQERGAGYAKRKAVALRKAGDDNVHTYRIPGITTTNKGTLISVYDNRINTTRDLPGNIDVGMSRSTDGGQTWEPMKVIMDMGEPHENNGVGDPAILFDPATNKIIVVALWSKGNRSIAGSGPGLTPDETGQMVISESSDDGITWSSPVSITAQVKDPAWKIFFQGPGNGMTMKDGKLVFAAQYWDAADMPHSTIIYSEDHGKTWKRGNGAKPNTTEAQVVETTPGKLMLSMRDNRGRFRSVSTTTDMGKTWTEHPTSYQTLPDPVCMAGFIKENMQWQGAKKDILLFSNPATSSGRYNMSIKLSTDLGENWPSQYQLLIDERNYYGYSVMTKIDDNTIGLLYEGTRDLYFMRVPIKDISK